MTVTLTWPEAWSAVVIGIRRHLSALESGLNDRHGFHGDGWQIHIEGAAGEMVVAKAIDRFFSGSVDSFKHGGDVGLLQVRTRSKPHYDLIVRSDDRDEDRYVLVTGKIPTFIIRGWIVGRDAKNPKWLTSPNGRPKAYFVPQDSLSPLSELL